jgi:hypothetical protein
MGRVFTSGRRAVMTGGASALHLRVVYAPSRNPTGGDVATFALPRGGNVCGVLTSGDGAVMATAAANDDARVAELCWRPTGWTMAQFTALRRRQMIDVLASSIRAVMAAGATI